MRSFTAREGFIRLETEDAKNGQARSTYLAGEAFKAVQDARRKKRW